MLCRQVPVPLSNPPLYIAEAKIYYSEHTNHNALEVEQATLPLSDKVTLNVDLEQMYKSALASISTLSSTPRRHQA